MHRLQITSAHNARVKDAVRLRERRGRQQQGRIIVDGARELLRAISADLVVRELFVCPEACHTAEAGLVLEWSSTAAAPCYEVTRAVLEKLAFGDRAEGVVGVLDTPIRGWQDIELPALKRGLAGEPLVAILEGIEKPGNLGAICRTADAAGVSAILLADQTTDVFGPNAIRSSLGTVFTMPIVQASADEILAWLASQRFAIFATRVGDGRLFTAADYRGPTAFVLGSEARGLSPTWSGAEITAVQVPMLGAVDSLNVSVVAGLLFYEAMRQRA
jgi:TrmH family RNA methyltransferase